MMDERGEPPRQRQPARSGIADYHFAASRAAQTRGQKEGTGRKTAKLPTSLDEMRKLTEKTK